MTQAVTSAQTQVHFNQSTIPASVVPLLIARFCFYLPDIRRLAGQEGIEPPTCGFGDRCSTKLSYWPMRLTYSMILVTTPAPTVRPPSRMAKRKPSSIAIGLMRPTSIFTLSPGITISTSAGSSTVPVTSVVRK